MTMKRLLKLVVWNAMSLLLFSGFASGASESIAIPDTSGSPGDFITIPVIAESISSDSMVTAAQLSLSFDSNVIRFDAIFFDGTLIPEGWIKTSYSPNAATFNLALAGDTSRIVGSGTLVYIRFKVLSSALPSDSSVIHFADILLNEWKPPLVKDGVIRITPTSVHEDENLNLPKDFNLGQNYPNPFNPTTTIAFRVDGSRFMVHSPARTTLVIYNVLGQKVSMLVNENLKAGTYQTTWDGENDAGERVPSGVYFYRLTSGGISETRKMVLMR